MGLTTGPQEIIGDKTFRGKATFSKSATFKKGFTVENTKWHEVGASGEPAFENSWANYSAAYNSAAYMKDSLGFVHLKGLVKDGTIGQAVFTLPAGYRPANTVLQSTVSNSAAGASYIYATGAVNAQIGNNAWFSLEGITFYAG